MFATTDDVLHSISVHHPPYRLGPARVQSWSAHVIELAGLPAPARGPEHACVTEPVDVETFLPEHIDAAVNIP